MKRTLLISFVTLVMMMGMPFYSHVYADDVIYQRTSKMPEFKEEGGLQACTNYVSEHLQIHPKESGRVICSVVIEKDGSVGDVKVLRSCDDTAVDNEVVRLIKTTDKQWQPGENSGKAVRVQIVLAVRVDPKE